MRPRIAVLGAGLIGQRHIAEARRQAQLCAIIDPSDAARALAAECDVSHFSALADGLATAKPDGVVIATPNGLHADHALACLAADLPCLIEKPIADSLANADRILAAMDRATAPVLVGHHRRHNPIVQRARALIEAGSLGEIVTVTGQFWLYKPDDYFEASWRRGPGAGPSFINFIHDVDLLRCFCGDVVEVQAMRANTQRPGPVEDSAAILMRFASGAVGSFTLSDTVVAPWSWEMTSGENPIYPHVPGACYHLGGTQASLSVPDLQLWRHEGARSWWRPIAPETIDAPSADAFALQFAHFLDVITGDAAPLVSALEARQSLALVQEVCAAALPQPEG